MSLTVLIAEDDPAMRTVLRNYLGDLPNVEVVGEAGDGVEALRLYEEFQPQMILLDIDMPKLNGLQVAEEIIDINSYAIIVFCTGSGDYKAKAMDLLAFDYITKPFDRRKLTRMMDRVLHFSGNYSEERKVILRTTEKYIIENPQDIIFITRVNRKVEIHCIDSIYTSNITLAALEDEFKSIGYIERTHKGFLVNMKMIKEIIPSGRNSYQVVMEHTSEKAIMTWDHKKELEKKYPILKYIK